MTAPTLYVIAGPNGTGKTSSVYNIISGNIPVLHSDEIAKQLRPGEVVNVSTQEYSNWEAQRPLQQHMKGRITFAIETNLADEETWKFFKRNKEDRL